MNGASLAAALGTGVAMAVVTVAFDLPALYYVRRRFRESGRLLLLPGTLVIALACVLLSRALGFLPGYFYGLIAGIAFHRRLRDEVTGRLAAVACVLVLAVSVIAWLAMPAVSSVAGRPDPSFWVLVLEVCLGGIFWCGLDTIVMGLLPLRFLQGSKITAWSRALWAVLYGLALMAFVHILLRPSTGYVADPKVSSPVIVTSLFGLFAVVSVAFWGYFRFRPAPAGVTRGGAPRGEPEEGELISW